MNKSSLVLLLALLLALVSAETQTSPSPSLPTISISLNVATVLENAVSPVICTLTRTGSVDADLSVTVNLGGTALLNTDFSINILGIHVGSNVIVIPAGSLTKTFSLTPILNSVSDVSTTVIASISANSLYQIGASASATLSITNVLPAPINLPAVVSVVLLGAANINEGTNSLVFQFVRVGLADRILNVAFSISGTASISTDYTVVGATINSPTSGTVQLGVGVLSVNVVVTALTDSVAEGAETVIFTVLSGTPQYILGLPSIAIGNIKDIQLPTVSIAAALSISLGGSTSIVLTRTNVLSGPLTVVLDISGSAVLGTDYTLSSGVVSGSQLTVTIPNLVSTSIITFKSKSGALLDVDLDAHFSIKQSSSYIVGANAAVSIGIDGNHNKRNIHERNFILESSASFLSVLSPLFVSLFCLALYF